MSFQWINQLSRIAISFAGLIVCVNTAAAQTIKLSAEEYRNFMGADKGVPIDQALLEKEYVEFAFSPKYKSGRICKVRLERASYADYDKVREVKTGLTDEPPKLVVAGMIGDKCRFTNGDPTVWGNAKMAVEGQETFLRADKITFEKSKELVNAEGNVRIYKYGLMTTGSQFKFKLNSSHYLLDTDKTKVSYVEVKKRSDRKFRTEP